MRDINNITIWQAGHTKTANKFKLILVSDDLNSHAIFYYELLQDDVVLVNGNVELKDAEYDGWDNSNEQAFELCANKLNIELI